MSSILKALKKLEEDKAERLDAPVDIGRDILRQPRRVKRSANIPALALALAATLAIAAGVLAVVILKTDKPLGVEINSEPPAMAAPAIVRQSTPAVPEQPPVKKEPEVVEVKMPPPPTVAGKTQAVPTRFPNAEKSAKTSAPKTPPGPAPAAKQPSPAVVPSLPMPHLAVSGIVFQADRQNRMAVVNDLPVMEGTVIEGAVVEEILSDRVRFDREGTKFEVKLKEP